MVLFLELKFVHFDQIFLQIESIPVDESKVYTDCGRGLHLISWQALTIKTLSCA